jgi:hypothetical protein
MPFVTIYFASVRLMSKEEKHILIDLANFIQKAEIKNRLDLKTDVLDTFYSFVPLVCIFSHLILSHLILSYLILS